MKKVIGYIVFAIFVIAVLIGVYFFLTKGYSGSGVNIAPILPTPSASTSTNGNSNQTGSVTSSKISLVITSPGDGAILGSTTVTVKGKTTPGAEVFVNDVSGKADASGNFVVKIGLEEGNNLIAVSANDSVGNATEKDINVTVASF